MVEMMKKETQYWWWFDSHEHSSRRSPWLQSTLGELDKKTKAMLKLIEEDADSFAQRAEMYYKKRPELISMVEDFYRTHRSLVERYDQLKSESAHRRLATLGFPISTKYQLQKQMSGMDQIYDSRSEAYDTEDSAESEVDDPEQEDETQTGNGMGEVEDPAQEDGAQIDNGMGEVDDPEQEDGTQIDNGMGEVDDPEQEDGTQIDNAMGEIEEPEHKTEMKCAEVVGAVTNEEVMKLQEEIESLREENRIQKDQLMQKDEEKREVIRQLSLTVEVLKLENVKLRKSIPRASPKKKSLFELEKLKGVFSLKLFNGSSRSPGTVVAL